MHFCYLFCQKCGKSWIHSNFLCILSLIRNRTKKALYSWFSAFFAKQTAKMHKTTSLKDDMRKILRPKFWSQGTPLGSMGPLSLKDPDQRFSKHDFLLIWDPYDFPKLVAWETQVKKLKTTAAQCGGQKHLLRNF